VLVTYHYYSTGFPLPGCWDTILGPGGELVRSGHWWVRKSSSPRIRSRGENWYLSNRLEYSVRMRISIGRGAIAAGQVPCRGELW